MLRFFRKYQKIILAVGGTILLVIFLVPQAITGMGGLSAGAGRSIANFTTLAGEEESISAADIQEAEHDLVALFKGAIVQAMTGVEVANAAHWVLLVREADAMGLIGGWDDAEALASIIGQRLFGEVSQEPLTADQVVELIDRNTDAGRAGVRRALVRLQGVMRLMALATPGFKVSPPRLTRVAAEVLPQMDAQVAVISAQAESNEHDHDGDGESDDAIDPADGAEPPAIAEEELQQQFEKYADVLPGEGERGFGYRLPDRVPLEWIEVPAQSVRQALESSEKVSRLEMRKYWLRNQEQFQPPGAPQGSEVTFEQVQDQVRQAMLDELTAEALGQIERFVRAELNRSTRDLARSGIHYDLPADWADQRIRLHLLAERLQQYARDQIGIPLPLPVYQRSEELQSAEDVAEIPGLGRAYSTEYGRDQRHTLADLIPVLKELGGSEAIPVQAGVAFGPLRQPDGSLYFLRIIDVQKSQRPQSLDEVREDVVADLQRLREFDRLAGSLEEIEHMAEERGMTALSQEYDTFPMPVRDVNALPEESIFAMYGRSPTRLPMLSESADVVQQITERGRELIQNMLAQGKTFEDLSAREITFAVPVPEQLAIVVVQFTNLRPASQDDVALYTLPLQDLIRREEIADDERQQIFGWDAMRERYAYESLTGEEDAAADSGA